MKPKVNDDDKPCGDHRCDCCEERCDLVFEDCGIGSIEAWGYVTNHEDWQWVSSCCFDTFTKTSGDNDEQIRRMA